MEELRFTIVQRLNLGIVRRLRGQKADRVKMFFNDLGACLWERYACARTLLSDFFLAISARVLSLHDDMVDESQLQIVIMQQEPGQASGRWLGLGLQWFIGPDSSFQKSSRVPGTRLKRKWRPLFFPVSSLLAHPRLADLSWYTLIPLPWRNNILIQHPRSVRAWRS